MLHCKRQIIFKVIILALAIGALWDSAEGVRVHLSQPELPVITVCPSGPPVCQFSKIQEAINAAPEDSSHPSLINPAAIIQVAPGVYQESLIILKSVILQGAGSDRVFLHPPKSDDIRRSFGVFISGSHIIVYISGFTIQDAPIKIMGVAGWPVSGVAIIENRFEKGGIYIYGTDSPIYIESNTFLPDREGGCGEEDVSAVYVGWLRILKNTLRCIHIEGATLLSSEKPRVLIAENSGAIIRISDSDDVVIHENTVRGIDVFDSEVVTITGNMIHEGSGIEVLNSSALISANQIEKNKGDGITIKYLINGREPSVQIMNNRVVRNRGFGILTEKLEYIIVCQGNEVRENEEGDYGIGTFPRQPSPELKAKCEGS